MGVVVLHHRLGNIQALPAGPPRTESQVRIFAVQKEVAVKSTEGFEHGAAIEGRGSAGQEDFFQNREILGSPAMAALLTAAIGADQHAGGIEAVFAIETDLRSAHTGIRADRKSTRLN